MEHTDWTPQSIVTLIFGVIATVGLAAATVATFIKGGK